MWGLALLPYSYKPCWSPTIQAVNPTHALLASCEEKVKPVERSIEACCSLCFDIVHVVLVLITKHNRSTDKIEELVDRVQKLENTISVLSRRGSPTDDESPRSIRRRELSSSPYSKSLSLSSNRPRSRGLFSQTPSLLRAGTFAEESAMILEVDDKFVRDTAEANTRPDLRTSQWGTK